MTPAQRDRDGSTASPARVPPADDLVRGYEGGHDHRGLDRSALLELLLQRGASGSRSRKTIAGQMIYREHEMKAGSAHCSPSDALRPHIDPLVDLAPRVDQPAGFQWRTSITDKGSDPRVGRLRLPTWGSLDYLRSRPGDHFMIGAVPNEQHLARIGCE